MGKRRVPNPAGREGVVKWREVRKGGSVVNEEPSSEGPGYVVLRCRTCKEDIARTAYAPYNWCHLSDEIKISPTSKITKNYDHEAVPDVIDIGGPSEVPPAPVEPPKQRRSNPFY